MIKRFLAAAMFVAVMLSISSCSVENGKRPIETTAAITQKETRIHNSFKDTLPDFGFDSAPVENYNEGISYSFSAECSENDFKKYINAVKKAGFEINAAEANGYYAAYSEDNYYVEITLVDDLITVYIKRV